MNKISLEENNRNIIALTESYIRFPDARQNILPELENNLIELKRNRDLLGHPIDKDIIKKAYLSESQEIIQLFRKYLPTPPLSLFDPSEQPSLLVQKEEEKKKTLAWFTSQNEQDPDVEKKVIFVQRHLRAKLRKATEIERLSQLYFNGSKEEAKLAIHDANTPYRPKCHPEIAARLMAAAQEAKPHSSIKHLASINNIAIILDTCLYGRKNLIDFFLDFRPAALGPDDIRNGDFNVICCGDLIDKHCLKERTIGLVFDLDRLLDESNFNKNPAFFFKQLDFGYKTDRIYKLGFMGPSFSMNTYIPDYSPDHSYEWIHLSLNSHYEAKVKKHSLISYNLPNMQQILALNFFRFLDNLTDKDCYYSKKPEMDAKAMKDHIYSVIDKFTDEGLVNFLTVLGWEASCTAEFNFCGAHKIDLNALTAIEIYQDRNHLFTVPLNELINELNTGSEKTLRQLHSRAPELFKSHRFKEHLTSKLNDKTQLDRFLQKEAECTIQ